MGFGLVVRKMKSGEQEREKAKETESDGVRVGEERERNTFLGYGANEKLLSWKHVTHDPVKLNDCLRVARVSTHSHTHVPPGCVRVLT